MVSDLALQVNHIFVCCSSACVLAPRDGNKLGGEPGLSLKCEHRNSPDLRLRLSKSSKLSSPFKFVYSQCESLFLSQYIVRH